MFLHTDHDRSDDPDRYKPTGHDPITSDVAEVLDEHRGDGCHGNAQGDYEGGSPMRERRTLRQARLGSFWPD